MFSKRCVIVALNHEKIGKHPEKIANIKHFIGKCNWERINYPSKKDYRNNTGKINQTIVVYGKSKKI